jgi:gluconokinase
MFVLGLDIGTTSTKAVIFDFDGKVICEHSVEYPIITPRPSWAEQDPMVILHTVTQAIYEVVQAINVMDLVGIGISSAMHSLILMDKNHRPLTNSIIWADNRSYKQAEMLKGDKGRNIYMRTGTPIHSMSLLSKLLWFKENEPELYSKTHKFISIKEFIIYHWFGEYVTDYSIASASGLFNIEKLVYDDEVLELLEIKKEQLSKLVPTTHVLSGLEHHFAQEMGLSANLPFIIGGGDGCLANLGIGAMKKGEVAITIGTSGAIRTVVPEPLTDNKQRTFCYALTEDHWVIGGASNNGAILLRWFKERFGADLSYEELTLEATKVNPGSDGLLCLPYLSGERAPIWNEDAKGCFFGMSLHHERAHFARSVMEGVIFNMYSIGIALEDFSGPFSSIRASGGFAQSPLWCQITADIFGSPLTSPESHQSSSWGAAILVLKALDLISDINDVGRGSNNSVIYYPSTDHHNVYKELFSIYEDLYRSLVGSFHKISAFQRSI